VRSTSDGRVSTFFLVHRDDEPSPGSEDLAARLFWSEQAAGTRHFRALVRAQRDVNYGLPDRLLDEVVQACGVLERRRVQATVKAVRP
jgi:hypothetical protein